MAKNETYEHVTQFLYAFLIRDLYGENIFLKKAAALFQRFLICIYDPAGAVNENVLVTNRSEAGDKALQLKDEALAVLFFVTCRAKVLKHAYTIQ